MGKKLQSAMEYLMTYGWAILIIAVVLGALFQLGIFNASTFTPKAPPGSCHVFRPNGPMTTSFINTQGICNGELPQYVWSSTSTSQAITPAITLTVSNTLNQDFTVSAWLYIKNPVNTPNMQPFFGLYTATSTIYFGQGPNGWYTGTSYAYDLNGYGDGEIAKTSSYQWHNVVEQEKGFVLTTYIDGVFASWDNSLPAADQKTIINPLVYIGGINTMYYGQRQFVGMMSNIQLYNTSLTTNEITALYNGGIGGAPIKLNNLVGWWPLNGDVKDYSGNNNNGVPSGVTFTSNWESGYSAP